MLLDLAADSDVLLVSFAAIPLTDNKPAFAFRSSVIDLPVKKAFFVDPYSALYHRGIPDVAGNIYELADCLFRIVQSEGIRRIVCVGNSGGGYAAIALGALAGAHEIHAFNPPTRLFNESEYHRRDAVASFAGLVDPQDPTADLKFLLNQTQRSTLHTHVYYSIGDSIDRRRCQYLRDSPGVSLVGYPVSSHNLARYLAREGTITQLLDASCRTDTAAFDAALKSSLLRAHLLAGPRELSKIVDKIRHRLAS
ncbi:MAG: hypothetical protein ACKVRP_01075 [Bacteroidota bacterium]